jgi:hypothetical protein
MAIVNAGYALPSFLVATLLIYFFAVRWAAYTPFPTHGWAGWESWVLPAVTLGFGPMAVLAQLVRGSMLETLQADYVRIAKAKGLRWRRVVGLHVFRNSLIPAVTAVGPLLGYLIAGSYRRDDLRHPGHRPLLHRRRRVARLHRGDGDHRAALADDHHREPDRRRPLLVPRSEDPGCQNLSSRRAPPPPNVRLAGPVTKKSLQIELASRR